MVSNTFTEAAHTVLTRILDRIFVPKHYPGGEIAYWEEFWTARHRLLDETGLIYEHHTPGKRWLYDRLIDALEAVSGGSLMGKVVAEFGAGSGYATILAVSRGSFGVVIDASRAALNYAQSIAGRLSLAERIKFIQADIASPCITDNAFDISFNAGVLEHYDMCHAAQILRQMVHAARPHGTVFSAVPNLFSPVFLGRMIRSDSKGSERVYSQLLLSRTFEAAGIAKSKGGYINAFLPVETPIRLLEYTRKLHLEYWAGPLSMLFYRWAIVS